MVSGTLWFSDGDIVNVALHRWVTSAASLTGPGTALPAGLTGVHALSHGVQTNATTSLPV